MAERTPYQVACYVRTPTHGAAVAAWLANYTHTDVTYDEHKRKWNGEAVKAGLEELSHRMLYQHIVMPGVTTRVQRA